MSLRTGLFEIEPDLEALVVSAELKRDEYKRVLDRIHTIALGCSTQNTIAYVELPSVIERIIARAPDLLAENARLRSLLAECVDIIDVLMMDDGILSEPQYAAIEAAKEAVK